LATGCPGGVLAPEVRCPIHSAFFAERPGDDRIILAAGMGASALEGSCPMLALKIAIFVPTIAAGFFFAFWETKIRRRLTDDALDQQPETISDIQDMFYGMRRERRRERILTSLPPEMRSKYDKVVALKFLFFAILIVEVFVLQR
jgi:hypothetical protein